MNIYYDKKFEEFRIPIHSNRRFFEKLVKIYKFNSEYEYMNGAYAHFCCKSKQFIWEFCDISGNIYGNQTVSLIFLLKKLAEFNKKSCE